MAKWYWKLEKQVRLSSTPATPPRISWPPSWPKYSPPTILQADGKLDVYDGPYFWGGDTPDFTRYNQEYVEFPMEGYYVYPEYSAIYGNHSGWAGGWNNISLYWKQYDIYGQVWIYARTSSGTETITSIFNTWDAAAYIDVIEISNTHYLICFRTTYDNTQKWYVVDIGTTVNRNTAPYYDAVVPSGAVRSFKYYHGNMKWDDGLYEYSADPGTHVITKIGSARFSSPSPYYLVEYSYNTEFPDTWVMYYTPSENTVNEQGYTVKHYYVATLDLRVNISGITFEDWDFLIDNINSRYVWWGRNPYPTFSRFDSNGYPVVSSLTGEVWVCENGQYVSKNCMRNWDWNKDEFIAGPLERTGYGSISYAAHAWYTDSGDIYTILQDNQSPLPEGWESSDWNIYKYKKSIGTVSVGPLTTSVSKYRGKYSTS